MDIKPYFSYFESSKKWLRLFYSQVVIPWYRWVSVSSSEDKRGVGRWVEYSVWAICEIPEPEVEWGRVSSQDISKPDLVNISVSSSLFVFPSEVFRISTHREPGSSIAVLDSRCSEVSLLTTLSHVPYADPWELTGTWGKTFLQEDVFSQGVSAGDRLTLTPSLFSGFSRKTWIPSAV